LILKVHGACGGSNEALCGLENHFISRSLQTFGNHGSGYSVAFADGDDFFSFEHLTSADRFDFKFASLSIVPVDEERTTIRELRHPAKKQTPLRDQKRMANLLCAKPFDSVTQINDRRRDVALSRRIA
jgi:hypothetical protein